MPSLSFIIDSSLFNVGGLLQLLKKVMNILLMQEFNIDKLQLVEVEKKKIRDDYDRKERLVTLRKKM